MAVVQVGGVIVEEEDGRATGAAALEMSTLQHLQHHHLPVGHGHPILDRAGSDSTASLPYVLRPKDARRNVRHDDFLVEVLPNDAMLRATPNSRLLSTNVWSRSLSATSRFHLAAATSDGSAPSANEWILSSVRS